MDPALVSLQKKLFQYLQSVMPKADGLEVNNLANVAYGASRESFTFDLDWDEDGENKNQAMVLRRDFPTGLLDHVTRETEFNILKCLEGSGVPSPKAFYHESDPKILNQPFIIMERVDGVVNMAFTTVAVGNSELRERIASQFVDTLAMIHNLDWRKKGFAFLGEPEEGAGYAKRELDKWESIIDEVSLEPDPILTEALIWLKENMPLSSDACLIHGDYKMDNIMCKKNNIAAVFDWEMATLGDFHDDLGWVLMQYYEVEGLSQGLMDKEWFVKEYQKASGRTVDHNALKFWRVFSNVKMIAISLTGGQRFLSGKSRKNIIAILPLLIPMLHKDIIEILEF
jgi:aminoglycoside phosphotransferase (APT) family kinase protein